MSSAPFELQRLDHLVLRTNNVERLVSFYKLIGCAVVREIESMRMVQLSAGASMIDIIGTDELASADPAGRNLDHFALRIEPFDESDIMAFCAENQIEAQTMAQPLLGADGYGPAIYMSDPDGNRVELKGSPQ
jgi:catechol-2,3-dioxygenase